MSRPEASLAAVPVTVGEGRSVRKKTSPCLVERRLAWLGSHWDGTLPPPKLSLPASGPKSMPVGRRGTNAGNVYVEQAPGYDGHVPGGIRLAAEESTVAEAAVAAGATANKAHRGSSTARDDECNNASTSYASTEFFTKRGVVGGASLAENDQTVADTDTDIRGAADRPADGPWFCARPSEGDYWSTAHDDKAWHPDLGEGGDGDLALDGDDEDTAAAEEISKESPRFSAHAVTRDSHADRRENSSNLRGSTAGTNDTVSELSFSVFHAGDGSEGEDHESEDHPYTDGIARGFSSDSPMQARPSTPRDDEDDDDDDDIDASHVEHLLQERRRWKLRAFESEHELRTLHARMEEKGSTTRTVERRLATPTETPTETKDINATSQESGSFGESMISDVSAAGSGFELDDRWQATSESESLAPAPPGSGSSSSAGQGGKPRPLEILEASSEGRFLEATSERGSDRTPAGGARGFDGAAGADDTCSDRAVGGGGGDSRVAGGDEPGKDGPNAHQLLRQEVEELKEKLRDTELRHAAAEATAVSVLQRARAAEMSRDVKEIQIRNLEIRLARYTKNGKHYKEACAQWRERQRPARNEGPDDLLRSRMEPLLPVVEEPGEGQPLPSESVRGGGGSSPLWTPTENTAAPQEPLGSSVPNALGEGGAGGGVNVGGGRAALDRFRHGCVVLGVNAARAGGSAMSAATAVASEAAREAVQSATAAAAAVRVGTTGEGGKRTAADEVDGGGAVEEYWGSDYCTSV